MGKRVNFIENFFENFFGLLFSIVFLILINSYYTKLSFLTDDFSLVLPFINISTLISIVFHALKLLITNSFFKQVTDIITTIVSVFVLYQLYFFFPFSFTGDNVLRIVMIVLMVILSIATIVQVVTLIVKGCNIKIED